MAELVHGRSVVFAWLVKCRRLDQPAGRSGATGGKEAAGRCFVALWTALRPLGRRLRGRGFLDVVQCRCPVGEQLQSVMGRCLRLGAEGHET